MLLSRFPRIANVINERISLAYGGLTRWKHFFHRAKWISDENLISPLSFSLLILDEKWKV